MCAYLSGRSNLQLGCTPACDDQTNCAPRIDTIFDAIGRTSVGLLKHSSRTRMGQLDLSVEWLRILETNSDLYNMRDGESAWMMNLVHSPHHPTPFSIIAVGFHLREILFLVAALILIPCLMSSYFLLFPSVSEILSYPLLTYKASVCSYTETYGQRGYLLFELYNLLSWKMTWRPHFPLTTRMRHAFIEQKYT